MCGIVGIVAARGAPPPNRERVGQATRALAHRGPDGSSHLFTEAVGLGHQGTPRFLTAAARVQVVE